MGSLTLQQMGGVFHCCEPGLRQRFFEQAGIPWLAITLLINPAIRRYDRCVCGGGGGG